MSNTGNSKTRDDFSKKEVDDFKQRLLDDRNMKAYGAAFYDGAVTIREQEIAEMLKREEEEVG
jgi:hypothetical protein